MDEAALYGFDVRGYTVLPSLLDVGQLAELNAEVRALCPSALFSAWVQRGPLHTRGCPGPLTT